MSNPIPPSLNADVYFDGKTFHVQTEDWGVEKSFVVSRIFLDGAVIRSFKVPYAAISQMQDPTIAESMKTQHAKIIELLTSGQLFFL